MGNEEESGAILLFELSGLKSTDRSIQGREIIAMNAAAESGH